MKLLSNFNTKLMDELYDSSIQKYGKERVLIVRRDAIYLWFKIIIPAIIWIMCLLILTWIKNNFISDFSIQLKLLLSIILIIASLIGIWKAIFKLIDYFMDFCIITPSQVLSYDQCGILSRASRSLDLNNLKSIDIDKNGFIQSFFDFGTVIFFSEGDLMQAKEESRLGTIRLNYIRNPSQVIHNITNVIRTSTTGNSKDIKIS